MKLSPDLEHPSDIFYMIIYCLVDPCVERYKDNYLTQRRIHHQNNNVTFITMKNSLQRRGAGIDMH